MAQRKAECYGRKLAQAERELTNLNSMELWDIICCLVFKFMFAYTYKTVALVQTTINYIDKSTKVNYDYIATLASSWRIPE